VSETLITYSCCLLLLCLLFLLSLNPSCSNLCHGHRVKRLFILYIVLLKYAGMFGVLQGRVNEGLSHRRWTFSSDTLGGVKPQCVKDGETIVTVLGLKLTGLHCTITLSLKQCLN